MGYVMLEGLKNIVKQFMLSDAATAFMQDALVEDTGWVRVRSALRKKGNKSVISLNSFISDIVEHFRSVSKAEGIKLKVYVQENTRVVANESLLKSILQHQINYAFEHHRHYGEDRYILIIVLDQPKHVHIEIADNGPGMLDEMQFKVHDLLRGELGDVNTSVFNQGLFDRRTKENVGVIELVHEEGIGSTCSILIPKC